MAVWLGEYGWLVCLVAGLVVWLGDMVGGMIGCRYWLVCLVVWLVVWLGGMVG